MNENENIRRMKLTIHGAVQGVGFRPFVYRLANEIGLNGWVKNNMEGVLIEVESCEENLRRFLFRLTSEKPERSFIQSLEHSMLDPIGLDRFTIKESDSAGTRSALVLPDIGTCPECLGEVFDPTNRRYLYPFTNCTHCGPRYSIIESLPYDRPNTSMKKFEMCDECGREYEDPENRRFHAQPNACPTCGPQLQLWEKDGEVVADNHMSLLIAAEIIRKGGIVAVKGIGGFHLMVDARNEQSVRLLRKRKQREEKPFALMYPDLAAVRGDCVVSEMEQQLLQSPEAPIVLLERLLSSASSIADSVAPWNPYLGVVLPYTPLYHIMMRELGFPVIATSGNISDEPICTDEREALVRLHDIADAFLVHNRPIVRHVDDSIVRVMAEREMVVRRARGFAPLPVHIDQSNAGPLLAVGAHLKNSVALTRDGNVFVSQHIGDLETAEAFDAFQKTAADLQRLYDAHPTRVIADLHPDYLSTKYAASTGLPISQFQHHYLHVASCMAENELDGQVLGVSWDGTGYGPGGTIWGGEFLLTDASSFTRAATFRPFRLPGGEKAVKEPRRAALGVLKEVLGDSAFEKINLFPVGSFSPGELQILKQMLTGGVNSPLTTSVGRLFDAVASIVGLRQRTHFEGQAAMELEFSIAKNASDDSYCYRITEPQSVHEPFPDHRPESIVDWTDIVRGILDDVEANAPVWLISVKFHNTLCEIIVDVAKKIGEHRVVLTGGCFQNKYLTERAISRLREEGFSPYWHQRLPPNDGGIALGQIYAFLRETRMTDVSGNSLQELITLPHNQLEEESTQ